MEVNMEAYNPEERLIAERAVELYRQTRKAMAHAAKGKVVDCGEQVVLKDGNEFLRQMLETSVKEHVQEIQEEVSRQCPECGEKMRIRTTKKKRP